ncbi:arginine--tRNA ligase [Candidatus Woesearchaeota archaeon]|nr:arginine--tRNA ligase [Candidatus Woesearchaeota archaeon]
MDFKKQLLMTLSKQIKETNTLEVPPNQTFGDFALPCFKLSKKPEELQKSLKLPNFIEKTEVKGPYLNFFIKKEYLAEQVIKKILKEKEKYGSQNLGRNKTITIDMSSPNVAKPFGIGHLRSTIIGNSIAKICEKLGYKIIKINYLGDWGTQFGKLITGYKHFGSEKELQKEPIKYLLDIYVKVNQDPSLEEESRQWFKKLEEGNKEALQLWKRFKDLSLKEFNKIYKILNVTFDVISGESLYNAKMEAIVKELKQKGLLKESEGALVVNLEEYNLGVCIIQKSDGTSLYATRDIALAIDRYKTYKPVKMIYEVGSEQKLHFKQFFKVLELMGNNWAKECVHVDHGLYLDKDGKKFATRKGKTVFMIDILNETIELAKQTIKEKNPNLKNKDEVARKVAIGAIFYGDLKNTRTRDITFNIEKFLDFEGDTGPYIQYTCARASSILKKAGKFKQTVKGINDKEKELIKELGKFPEAVVNANKQLSPHLIANYTFQLSQKFNEFYHACPVLTEKEPIRSSRLAIVQATKYTLASALSLLGIEAPEKM